MAEKIRVLIVDDNEDTRDGTRRLLEYEDNVEIVGFADNGQDAIYQVQQLDPHVVLMDINMPVMNGIDATQYLSREIPNSKVIIVSVQDDPNYMRSAMRAGAVDFVAKPISSDDMSIAIKNAFEQSLKERSTQHVVEAPKSPVSGPGLEKATGECKVISVMGTKGGVGKTTIAISLAVGLLRSGQNKKVLLIDSNTNSGSIAVTLNVRGQFNVVDVCYMTQEEELDAQQLDGLVVPHDSGIRILVAPNNPLESDPLPVNDFRTLINEIRPYFDYIVIDTAPFLDPALGITMQVADEIVVVATSIMPALKDTRILFTAIEQTVEREQAGEDARKDNITLVLNQFDTRFSRITPEQITNFLRHKIDAVVPFDMAAISAINNAVPLITMDERKSPAVAPIKELVNTLRMKMGQLDTAAAAEQKPRSGFFSFGG